MLSTAQKEEKGDHQGSSPRAESPTPSSPITQSLLATSTERIPAKRGEWQPSFQPLRPPGPRPSTAPSSTRHILMLGVTSPTGFRYVSSMFLASVAAYSSRCRTSPALPGESLGARCPSAAHRSPVSGASSAEPAHSRFWEGGREVCSARCERAGQI